jgi:hypothetical protein
MELESLQGWGAGFAVLLLVLADRAQINGVTQCSTLILIRFCVIEKQTRYLIIALTSSTKQYSFGY